MLAAISWTNKLDTKFEVKHVLKSATFDLDARDRLLIDMYVPSSAGCPKRIGVWDEAFNWHPMANKLELDQWFTAEFDVSDDCNTGLDTISALFFENL